MPSSKTLQGLEFWTIKFQDFPGSVRTLIVALCMLELKWNYNCEADNRSIVDDQSFDWTWLRIFWSTWWNVVCVDTTKIFYLFFLNEYSTSFDVSVKTISAAKVIPWDPYRRLLSLQHLTEAPTAVFSFAALSVCTYLLHLVLVGSLTLNWCVFCYNYWTI